MSRIINDSYILPRKIILTIIYVWFFTQIIFEGIIGARDSDLAIDDVDVKDVFHCCEYHDNFF